MRALQRAYDLSRAYQEEEGNDCTEDNLAYEEEGNDCTEDNLEREDANQRLTFEDYKATLPDFDQGHVEQFMNWGKHQATESEREILKFLAATCGVEGRSLNAVQCQLTFTRKLPGMKNALTKAIEKSWPAVFQVWRFDSIFMFPLTQINFIYKNVMISA